MPKTAGNAAQQVLSAGVDFSTITMAVTAPEEDPLPQLLEEYMGRMRDISRYCTFVAMDKEEALTALKAGEVVAVLELPENFVDGILYGTNPDVTLIVNEDRPVESLLTLWVGQSAADLLSTAQSGIYAVLDAYDLAPPDTLSRDQVVMGINLCYVNWTLSRQDVFRTQTVSATGVLPVDMHYALSLLLWLCLSLAPLFAPVYTTERLLARKRLRSIGHGSAICCLSDICACAAVLFCILLLPLAAILKEHLGAAVLCSAAAAMFCALFGSACCLLTGSTARCAALSFTVSLSGLVLAGGILPPVLLPQSLQQVSWLSPVACLRSFIAACVGYDVQSRALVLLCICAVLMLAICLWLYHRRTNRQEVAV